MTGLFFDLDGTIADSEPQHYQAWRDALASLAIEMTWSEYVSRAIGHSDEEILLDFAGHLKSSVNLRDLLAQKKRTYLHIVASSPPVHQETIDLLRELRPMRMALVTSSSRLEAHAVLEAAALVDVFDTLVCIDDVAHAKPHPEPYNLAKKRLRVIEGVVFEDSDAGLTSASAAGLLALKIESPRMLPTVVRNYLAIKTRGTEA